MMATRRRDAAARRKLTIPADFLDIGAGQLGDVAAGLVMARAFGDDAGGRRDAVFPIEREAVAVAHLAGADPRSEEHTSELQSLMRISYAVFCLKKKKKQKKKDGQQ